VPDVRLGGIDWAKADHAVCVIDAEGEPVQRVVIPHSKAGIDRVVALFHRLGVVEVGIERPDGPLVAGLLAAGLVVLVIPPAQVKSLRRRYGSAGNKDDRFDAYVLADTVRTDRRRLTPLRPDTSATVTLRALVRARGDLVGHRVAVSNQLRAHLNTVLPAAVDLFSELTLAISRAFLATFSTQDAVDALTLDGWTAWLAGQRYRHTPPAVLLQRLRDAPAGVTGPAATALAGVTHAYLAAMTSLIKQIAALEEQIADALTTHPDGSIFTSLPRSGSVRAARLLAEIGDARGRFPNAAALCGLAGVTPSTRSSGQVNIVAFRWAVDKQLRAAVCDFAADSRHANPWAENLYRQARARGHRHPHAVRILARAWLTIIWKCWTTNTPYDPQRHRTLQALINPEHKPAPTP
jgi:transposase